jgi:ankyrin repeat protein
VVTSGHVSIIQPLLDHPEIDLNFVARDGNHSGWTALSKAAHYRNLEVAKLLLEREDINTNLPDNCGWASLF